MSILRVYHQSVVSSEHSGVRLDTFILNFPYSDYHPSLLPSRTTLQRWISDGNVLVNEEIVTDKSYKVKEGDRIVLDVSLVLEPDSPPPEPLQIPIIYRDEHCIVINKPPGISSHPVPTITTGSVINFLKYLNVPLPITANRWRPGIVHRLDKNTSGLMVVATSDSAFRELVEMIKRREVQREYIALVFGNPPVSGTIEGAIERDETDRRKMRVGVSHMAKPSITHYWIIKEYPGFSLLRCKLETGRTHQIRVHLSHIGYPVVGDVLYGGRNTMLRVRNILKKMNKQDSNYPKYEEIFMKTVSAITADSVHLLHANRLSFPHPITGEPLSFTVEPHDKFRTVLELLEQVPHTDVQGGI